MKSKDNFRNLGKETLHHGKRTLFSFLSSFCHCFFLDAHYFLYSTVLGFKLFNSISSTGRLRRLKTRFCPSALWNTILRQLLSGYWWVNATPELKRSTLFVTSSTGLSNLNCHETILQHLSVAYLLVGDKSKKHSGIVSLPCSSSYSWWWRKI